MKKLVVLLTIIASLFLLTSCSSTCNCGYAQAQSQQSLEAQA